MNIYYVDFETYYDKSYSLSKMQTDAYIKDALFEVIGVTVALNDAPAQWFSGTMEETLDWLWQFDWATSAACCHHTLFDGFIMAHHFGIRPKLWMDTVPMMRRLYPHLSSFALAALAKEFGLPAKGIEVHNAIGKHRSNFTAYELSQYADYCVHDNYLCRRLCDIALPLTEPLDLKLIDMTTRMFTEPQFVGDIPLLQQLHTTEVARKAELLANLCVDKDVIMSNKKLEDALTSRGVTPPTKVSKITGKVAPAFAKTDKDFVALLDHPDEDVQAIVAARLGVKSTIAETRVLKMTEMAQRGPLPVYLNYWGAKTTGRYAGGNSCNWQNLPARGPTAGIRLGIKAPPGHSVVVGDSSNIELRVTMVGAGQMDVVQKIIDGVDLYCDFASKLFGRTITKADKKERTLGKIAMLLLQYGGGAERYRESVRLQSGDILTESQAKQTVSLYRSIHNKVQDFWEYCGGPVLQDIARGCDLIAVDHHAWCLTSNEGFGVAAQPGVKYAGLKYGQYMRNGRAESSWAYRMGRETVLLHGAKVVENWSQHVAGRIVLWQTARINERFPVALSVHDEAVCVVPDERVDEARAYMEECLSMAPSWCRGHIPLACEVGVGKSYGEAK